MKSILKVEVDDDADIDVELTGVPALALVKPGDYIQARGDQTGEGLGYTNHLTFKLEQPLDPPAAEKKAAPEAGAARANESLAAG